MISENRIIYLDGNTVNVKGTISGESYGKDSVQNTASLANKTIGELSTQGGGCLQFGPGRFPLIESIRIPSRTVVRGEGKVTILTVTKDNESGIGILAEKADHITIQNLIINGDKKNNPKSVAGIKVDGCGDMEISSVHAVNFGLYGIWMYQHCFLSKIRNCYAAGNDDSNIFLDFNKAGSRVGFSPDMIENCIVYRGGYGIRGHKISVMNIVGCLAYQTERDAFLLEGWDMDHDTFRNPMLKKSFSTSILISGCRSFQTGGCAVRVVNSHELNVSSNIFCWTREEGMVLDNVIWGNITGNEVIDSGVRIDPPKTGIWIKGGSKMLSVTGNSVFNWPEQTPMLYGIKEEADCYKNIIANNTINYYTEFAVLSEGKESKAEGNVIDHRSYCPKPPYDGRINDFYQTWKSMGPYEEEQFDWRLDHYETDKLQDFIDRV